ncbi:Sodium/calcium exchanger protein-domain-containing protein [Dactylonectria macrodidyma]|uniref:Sodium/calcium exchanger protein-domain-containing protein n=1 Tax=Dactylonectria macrodidyma TaxID=307937 RepID=A0A9P9FF84_9HYPO|nr:Sodium/calcium exchanger protein-domain-containing protein [Dactylonectria macrodidyma]
MSQVNHFSIKRQAHALSRTSSDQSWNPFRHVSWDRQHEPAGAWDGGRLEHQATQRDSTTGEKLGHASTDPTGSRTDHNGARTVARDWYNVDTVAESSHRDVDERSRDRSISQPTEVGADVAVSQRSLVDDKEGLRNRKHDDDEAPRPTEGDDDKREKMKAKKQEGLFRNVQPKQPFTVANQLQRTFLNSWINILMVAAPVGIALNYIKSVNRIAVFVVNFIAIIPLAAMLSFATEEIALRTGEVLGGLINATFGNAVELIVAILALADDKVIIVQTSLIGSILSNLLLVMGFCFFFGGLRRQQQYFNQTVAQTAASLLALAVASVIVPTVFDIASTTPTKDVANLSRGTSVILLVVYGAYLLFQLKTHQDVFTEESQKVAAKPWSSSALNSGAIKQGLVAPGAIMGHGMADQSENERLSKMLMNPQGLAHEDDDEEEEPQLHFLVAIATLTISTVFIALCAEFMVDSIDAVTEGGSVSEEFVGLILLPIVGNAAEHATAVTVAIKDKMDLAIGVAVGSSMQVALFLIPLLVIIGWGMGNDDMNLSFDMFQVAVMFVAVLLTNYLIADGSSHWLEGWLLICLYAIIAVCSWWYPI